MTSWVPLWAAVVAALAAVTGYVVSNRAQRLQDKAEVYAKALAAVDAYKHLPYRIRRRTKSDNETRSELGQRISDVQQEIVFYVEWLSLEPEKVAILYRKLVKNVWEKGKEHREKAWRALPIDADVGMSFADDYPYTDKEVRNACLIAMQEQLRRSRFGQRHLLELADFSPTG